MSSERAVANGIANRLEPFHYLQTDAAASLTERSAEMQWDAAAGSAAPAQPQAGEKRDKESYERGLQEGREQGRAQFEAQIAGLRQSVASSIEQFKKERESYFNRIEPEVVQLSLAMARKILHREAQVDPLLLTGVVHVALEKLDAGSRVRLRAHPDDVRHWAEFFSQWNAAAAPELIGDPAMQKGECALETEIGSTHLSLETQLKEIEQGFMDLLEQRPRVR